MRDHFYDITDIFSELEPHKDVDTKYSLWIKQGNEYSPAVELTSSDKLPAGIYKINIDDRSDYKIIPYTLDTDQLYVFKNNSLGTILKEVKTFWENEDIYTKYKIMHRRGLLLEGPSGCGKTAAISLLSAQLIKNNGIVFIINNKRDFEIAADALRSTVRIIEPNRNIITIIEDVDKIIDDFNGNDAALLDFIDGKTAINHHFVIFTSNNTTNLSPALLRPSRIDMRVQFSLPSQEIREEFFKYKGFDGDKLIEYINKTDGLSLADLKEVFICTEILKDNIDDVIDKIKNPLSKQDYLLNSTRISI